MAKWGSFKPSPVIKVFREPAQLRIVIDYDVPAHRANSPAVLAALDVARQIAEKTVQSACGAQLHALGVKYVGSDVERD